MFNSSLYTQQVGTYLDLLILYALVFLIDKFMTISLLDYFLTSETICICSKLGLNIDMLLLLLLAYSFLNSYLFELRPTYFDKT